MFCFNWFITIEIVFEAHNLYYILWYNHYLLEIFVKSDKYLFNIFFGKVQYPFTWEQFVAIFESSLGNYK